MHIIAIIAIIAPCYALLVLFGIGAMLAGRRADDRAAREQAGSE